MMTGKGSKMATKDTRATAHTVQTTGMPLNSHLRKGLTLLWRAYAYAQDASADVWDFALEKDELYRAGLTISDLRWLVAKGIARHARETSVYGDAHRSFRSGNGLNFVPTTCLALTPKGVMFAERSLPQSVTGQATLTVDRMSTQGDPAAVGEKDLAQPGLKPHWHQVRHELCLAGLVVKRYRVPAPNQVMILNAFQEEGWPEHIDDPLPVSGDVDPHTRLHDAINRLNGRQTRPLLRFHGNGNGTGVSWEPYRLNILNQISTSPPTNE